MNMNSSLYDLKDRALRAIAAMKTKLGTLFKRNIMISLHLFDSLIKPILLYASDFWGCLPLPKKNPIENIQARFCKELLGVQKQTHNTGGLLELGRIPLTIFGKKNCVKNWERIAVNRKANNITTMSYDFNISNDTGWPCSIRDSVSKIGLMTIFYNKTKISPSHIVFSRERDIFHQEAFFQIQNQSSKLKTLALIKTDIGLEEYLSVVKNVSDRVSISKLRLSNHCLMIEKGRHTNTEPDKRFCPFCPSLVEDELHFVIRCPVYSKLREKLLNDVKSIMADFYVHADEMFLFWFLLKCPNISHLTAHFINLAGELRSFLISKHKNTW